MYQACTCVLTPHTRLPESCTTYARGLIAAGDREAIETILAIARKGALDDEVLVEVEACLEGRPFTPR
jgi:hypothetical protein